MATHAPMLPSPPRHERPALRAMVIGVVWTAVVWFGLAVFVIGLAYPFSTMARFWIMMAGSWLVAGGLAYAITSRRD